MYIYIYIDEQDGNISVMTKGPQLDGMTIQYKQQYERHQSIHILQTQDDDDDNI